MALALQKIILAGAGSNTPGAFYQTVTIAAQDTNTANTVVPAGLYTLFPLTTVSIIATPDNGTTWNTVMAANTGGVVVSDGVNVAFKVTGGSNVNVVLLTVDGGEAATGTYNK